jgi:hypothetical protein
MAETVHLEFAGPFASGDLIEYLAARGLTARTAGTGDCCELEVDFATSADERLRSAIRQALRGWIADRDGSQVVAEVGADRFVLRPPGE